MCVQFTLMFERTEYPNDTSNTTPKEIAHTYTLTARKIERMRKKTVSMYDIRV